MEVIKNWVAQIVYVSVLAALAEFLIPNSSIKKYVKVVIGLVVMMTIINPVLNFLKGGIDVNNFLPKELITSNNVDIHIATKQAEEERNQLVVDEYRKRLIQQIKERTLAFPNINDAYVNIDFNNDINDKEFGKINKINIRLFMSNDSNKEVTKINKSSKEYSNYVNNINDIKNDISKFYNVPLKNITIEEK